MIKFTHKLYLTSVISSGRWMLFYLMRLGWQSSAIFTILDVFGICYSALGDNKGKFLWAFIGQLVRLVCRDKHNATLQDSYSQLDSHCDFTFQGFALLSRVSTTIAVYDDWKR